MTPGEYCLTKANVADYLKSRGVVSSVSKVTALGGGVSNTVLQASTDRGDLVLKQPFENLNVEDDWPADLGRVHNEASATRVYENVLRNHGIQHTTVPEILFEDHENHVIVIQSAPGSARMWKEDLLEGRVDVSIAKRLGRVLGRVHDSASGNERVRDEFQSKKPFYQLRLEPYHETTADRHPEVRDPILRERDRLRDVSETLVHGDYSPKNVLVNYETENHRTWILDFEVAHWGDPAFDTAFMLNHLFIKSIYRHSDHEHFVEAARSFWEKYNEVGYDSIEGETVRELGVLMLARMDGKSPVEYVTENRVADSIRDVAIKTLLNDVRTVEEFVDLTDRAVESL